MSDKTQALREALLKLDVGNTNHWTADGQPRLDTVRMLMSDSTISRDEVDAAIPGFSRTNTTAAQPWQAQDAATQPQEPAQQPQAAQPSVATPSADLAPQAAQAPAIAEPPAEETREQLEAELAACTEALAQAMSNSHQWREEAQRLHNLEDILRVKIERKFGKKDTDTWTIQQYLASQNRAAQERGERARLLREAGVELRELVNATKVLHPIDEAKRR